MLLGSHHKCLHTIVTIRNSGVATILGNPQRLDEAARLAQDAQVTAFIGSPTSLTLLAPKLGAYCKRIRILTLWGEYCSTPTYTLLKEHYPNALFSFTYGQSETSGAVAFSTDVCAGANNVLHANEEEFFFEIEKGELIISTLTTPLPTPLIRYRTGDSVRFADGDCPCGDTTRRIEILGRINGDVIRTAGGEVRVAELDRVMEPLLPYIEPLYRLEVGEAIEQTKKKGTLHLFVTKRPNVRTPDASLCIQIDRALRENMRLSQTMRVEDAVKAELLEKPQITFVAKLTPGGKYPKLVRKF